MIVAEQRGSPYRVGQWWSLQFWYRCTEHPEFGGDRKLMWLHLREYDVPGREVELILNEAEDRAVGLERQPDGRIFEVAR